MNTDGLNRARDFARQGVGLPGNASVAEQNAYADEQRRMSGSAFPGFRMPGVSMDPVGLVWLVVGLPIFAILFMLADLRWGWRWWRWCGLVLGLLVGAAAFAWAVKVGVYFDVEAQAGKVSQYATADEAAEPFLQAATACAMVLIFFLIPRTILAVVAIVGVIMAWNAWISPML